MTNVICIAGKAGSGKDTVGQMLSEAFRSIGYNVLIAHYADLVKYCCTTFFKWDGVKDERGRSLLQFVGTDVVRAKDPDYWVNFIKDALTFFHVLYDYVIIPDCRFPNEIDIMRDNFPALLLRVVRPNYESKLTEKQKNHQSEVALDGYPADIDFLNDVDTLDELWDKMPHLTEDIENKFVEILLKKVAPE